MHSMFLIETQIRTMLKNQCIGSAGLVVGSLNLSDKISGKIEVKKTSYYEKVAPLTPVSNPR